MVEREYQILSCLVKNSYVRPYMTETTWEVENKSKKLEAQKENIWESIEDNYLTMIGEHMDRKFIIYETTNVMSVLQEEMKPSTCKNLKYITTSSNKRI